MEIVIVLLVGVFCGLRYGATDLVAAARGTDAWIEARAERARMRHELAMKRAERGRPTVGEAIAERIRTRGGGERPHRPRRRPGPFAEYRRELWHDMWTGAGERRRVQAERRRAGDLPRQRAARWLRNRVAGRRPEPWTAERLDRDPPVDAEWTADHHETPDGPLTEQPTPAPREQPAPAGPDNPPPTWAPVTPIRKDQPMTTASSEITSPEGALAFAEGIRQHCRDRMQEIENALASLATLEVTGEPLRVIGRMSEHLALLSSCADEAAGFFRQHISTADTVRADQSFGGKQYANGS